MVGYLRDLGLTVVTHSQRLMYHDGSDSYVCVDWNETDDRLWRDCDDVSDDPMHIARATARGEGPRQITFADHDGHFGGSGDGAVIGMEKLFPEWNLQGPGLLEAKTHGDKSFVDIAGKLEDWRKYIVDPFSRLFTGKGVLTSKIEHYVQMQIYMKYFGFKWALYIGVDKNTDDYYIEIIHYKPEVAEAYADRAKQIIPIKSPPARITENADWWECKFCDFREVCHHGALPSKNCRSCVYAEIAGPDWLCTKYHQILPLDFMPKGCDLWEPIVNG